jgi:trehalose utilization protein
MDRRTVLKVPLLSLLCANARAKYSNTVRIVVWDEQQPAQKQAYENFLGNAIADYLAKQSGLHVRSVRLDDPEQGLSSKALDECDVLIWWGHIRHREITPATGRAIVQRIKAAQLSLIALHSAHWSTPFVEAMWERSRIDAANQLAELGEKDATIREIEPKLGVSPKRTDDRTPNLTKNRTEGAGPKFSLALPNCCFPAYRADGKPSHVRVVKPEHPIAHGIPERFDIPQTEMYDEPFHIPPADEVVFEERWDAGERFRSGLVWKIGKGQVIYFRPGHETYPVFKQAEPLKILENAARWLGQKSQ